MKRILLSLACICYCFNLSAQSPVFEWVETHPVGWDFNPAMVSHAVTTDGLNRSVTARLLGVTLYFGDLYGNYNIEVRDALGNAVVSYPLTGRTVVQSLAADAVGNVYVGGVFVSTLHLGVDDSLVNTNPMDTLNKNAFLLKLDHNGNLVWKRNLELSHPGLQGVDDIRVDPTGNVWYAYSEWMNAGHIVKIDANGNDTGTERVITGVNGVSSFDFDPHGAIFLAGSAPSGTVTLGGLTYEQTETYAIYIARFDSSGEGTFARFAHDVTFQHPQVKADLFGNAFVGGTLMDSLDWGMVHFVAPQWVNDFWLVKVGYGGGIHWGQQTPQSATLTGDIAPADGLFIATDSLGDAYFLGNLRGSVTWDNGDVSDAGSLPSTGILLAKFSGFDGLPVWTLTTGVGTTYAHDLAADKNGNLYFTQTPMDTTSYGFIPIEVPQNQNTFLLAKLSNLIEDTVALSNHEIVTKDFMLFPNPFATSIVVPQDLQGSQLDVFDVTGKKVTGHQGIGGTVNFEALPAGCYFLQFRNERVRFIGKLIKE